MALAPRSRPNEGLAGWGEPVVEARADIPVRWLVLRSRRIRTRPGTFFPATIHDAMYRQEPPAPFRGLVVYQRVQELGNFEFAVFQHGLAVAEQQHAKVVIEQFAKR